MQFAIVNNKRTAPSPRLKGACPACGGIVDARCGEQRIHHWAHRGARSCDPWWETETPWHRAWKGRFPDEWQEVVLHDGNGEKHIADVRTKHGVTIEFQHSHLKSMERRVRENFYGNMLWVVDGSRLKRDLPRFVEGFNSFWQRIEQGLFSVPFPEETFPKDWLDCAAPVLFDFGSAVGSPEKIVQLSQPLWCLLPGRALGQAVVVALPREDFVRIAQGTAHPIQPQGILDYVAECLSVQRRLAREPVHSAMMVMRSDHGLQRRRYRRGYARF